MDVTPSTIVDISITEVIIEGLGAVDRLAMRQALERDLARLVGERGLPGTWSASGTRADATANLDWDGRGGTDGLSAALAEQIYQGFVT